MQKQNDERLFPKLDGALDRDGLADNLYSAAYELEDILMWSGAKPGEDYTRMELLQLVQPFVLEACKQPGRNMQWNRAETQND